MDETVALYSMPAIQSARKRRAAGPDRALASGIGVPRPRHIDPTSVALTTCANGRLVAHRRPLSACAAASAVAQVAVLQNAALI